jgi:hypothetical protein
LVKNEDGTVKFDDKGAAAQALIDAKADAANLYQVKGNYEEAGAAADAYDAAKDYVDDLVKNEDGTVKFDEAGAAAQALIDAKADAANLYQVKGDYEEAGTAAGLNAAMDERVAKLEAIDHDKLAADAAASAVSTILDGASDSFDTLKEVAEWIANNEHADDVATLVTDVANLKAIDHDAYKGADDTVLAGAKEYADDLVKNEDGTVKFDDKGAAAQALADAKADAANLYQEKGDYLTASDFEFAEDSDIDGLFD